MKEKTFTNYSWCGKCANILDDGACAFCQSVKNSNEKIKDMATNQRPVPVVGFIALIITVAAAYFLFMTFCTTNRPQTANRPVVERKK